jgi:hypothetical protein
MFPPPRVTGEGERHSSASKPAADLKVAPTETVRR